MEQDATKTEKMEDASKTEKMEFEIVIIFVSHTLSLLLSLL